MKALALFAVILFALTGCVTSYDCGMQTNEPSSFDACRQAKGSGAYRYCTDNPRYKNFAECAQHATKDGADLCVTRKATRPEIHDCLNGKGPALVTETDRAKAKPLPKIKIVEDPQPASKGTGQFVTGIVLTAVGPGLGLLLLAASKTIDCTEEKDEDDRDICEDNKEAAPTGAVIYAGLGLGIGLPLLFDGIEKRRLYKEWLARHPEAHSSLRLNLLPLVKGGLAGVAAQLTYDLD